MSVAENEKIAFIFPGVGIEHCGHEAGFVARHRCTVSPYLEQASERADVDLAQAIAAGELRSLSNLAREILTYAFNCAAAAVYMRAGLVPTLMAGHSMGIYSAMVSAGSLSFSDGLGAVEKAHELVQATCAGKGFGMAAVVGLSAAEVTALLDTEAYADSCIANVNNATSVVLTGRRRELELFLKEAEAHGALKAGLLGVDAPYHHPVWAAGASAAFRHHLQTLTWQSPDCPIISSIDGSLLTDVDTLLDFTARNLCSPICWQGVTEAMGVAGIGLAVECGAGVSLTQNARFLKGCPPHTNIRSVQWRLGI